jgi:hypothetical protein
MQQRPTRSPARRAAALLGLAAMVGAGIAPARADVAVDGATVRVTKADCRRLVKHRPDAGVAYQPGVDVHGEPVAPADLHDRPKIELPETVRIPIEVDLDARYGLPPDASFKGDVQVGEVEVDLKTGAATFNGQPLTAGDAAELRAKCQKVLEGGE